MILEGKMKKDTIGFTVIIFSVGLYSTQLAGANLTLTTGGKVTIELISSDADLAILSL
jgi:hypothetical protein